MASSATTMLSMPGGRSIRSLVAFGMAFFLVLAGLAPMTAVAQLDGDSYRFQTGNSVAWSGPWQFEPEYSGVVDERESVFLQSQLGTAMVLTLPSNLDVAQIRDEVLELLFGDFDGVVAIDRGAYGSLSYSLDLLTLEGFDFGAFTLFRSGTGSTPTFVTFIMAPVGAYASEVASAQRSIQVDGTEIFNGVGGDGLQSLLESVAGPQGDPLPPPEDEEEGNGSGPDAEPEEDPVEDPEEDARETPESSQGGLGGGLGTDKLWERGSDEGDDETTEAPAGETGLIDDNTFVSPLYLVETTWDASWVLDDARDPNVILEDNGLDQVSLAWTGDGPAFIQISYLEATMDDVAPFIDYWQTDEFLDQAIGSPDGGVVLAEAAQSIGAVVLVDYTSDGAPVMIYRELRYLEAENAFVLVYLLTVPQLGEAVISDAQAGIQIAGEPALDFLTIDEVLDAFS